MTNKNEEYIIENITFEDDVPSVHDRDYNSCPHTRFEEPDFTKTNQNSDFTLFFWTKEASYNVKWGSNVAFISFFFSGIYSDKYGGHGAILFGLLLSAVVTSVSYLTLFMNSTIYLIMLALRKSAYGIVFSATISLAGKLSVPYRRTFFVSIVFAGARLGSYLGYVVPRIVDDWRVVSYISGGVCFITAFWWLIAYKSQHFPRVPTYKQIPWRELLVSISFVNLCFLLFSFYLFFKISMGRPPLFDLYIKNVLFFRPENEWFAMLLLCITQIFGYLYCGASCDYLVSVGLLSTYNARRILYIASLIVLLFSVLVIKVSGCDLTFVVACWIMLSFVSPITNSIAVAEVLDVAPAFSGVLSGSVYAPLYFTYYAYEIFLDPTFIRGSTLGDVNNWSSFFFTLTIAAIGTALPYLLCGVKNMYYRNEVTVTTHNRMLAIKSSPNSVTDNSMAGTSGRLKD